MNSLNSTNEIPTPPVAAVLKAREIAESANGAAADRDQHLKRSETLKYFVKELQDLSAHFPDNAWLRDKVQTLPSAIETGRVPSMIFDELTLGCQQIVSNFKHILQNDKEMPTTAEANAA